MAKVTKTSGPGIGARIGNAISGAMQGVQLVDKLKTAQTARDQMQAQAESMRQAAAQRKQETTQKGLEGYVGLISRGATLEGKVKDAYFKANEPLLQQFANAGGLPHNPGDISIIKEYSELFKQTQDMYQNYTQILDKNDDTITSGQVASDLGNMISVLPPAMQGRFKPMADSLVQQYQQKERQAQASQLGLEPTKMVDDKVTFEDTSIEKAKVAVDMQKIAAKAPAAPKIPAALVAADKEDMKQSFKMAGSAQKRIGKIDNALSAMQGVYTDIISGNMPVGKLRRAIGDEKFELLQTSLNDIGLDRIAAFAAEAGARAIDSDGERAFLQSVNPETAKRPKNNLAILLIEKGQALSNKLQYEAKRKFIAKEQTLNGFEEVDPLNGTAKFFDPKTLDVIVVAPGEEPAGYQPVQSLYGEIKGQKREPVVGQDIQDAMKKLGF